jgi:hypothetical protein
MVSIPRFKNPGRASPEALTSHYTPQHELLGLNPEEMPETKLPNGTTFLSRPEKIPLDNPRSPNRPTVRQDYAPPFREEKVPFIPNVGNHMEQNWASVDGQIVDDLSEEFDANAQIIDNNDFVSLPEDMHTHKRGSYSEAMLKVQREKAGAQDLGSLLHECGDGEYLLFVDGELVSSSQQHEVENEVEELVLGKHDLARGVVISPERITVLRKIGIKMGVSLVGE